MDGSALQGNRPEAFEGDDFNAGVETAGMVVFETALL
jgi:hypothetical protein